MQELEEHADLSPAGSEGQTVLCGAPPAAVARTRLMHLMVALLARQPMYAYAMRGFGCPSAHSGRSGHGAARLVALGLCRQLHTVCA